MVKGAWQSTFRGVSKESDMTERPSTNTKLETLVFSTAEGLHCGERLGVSFCSGEFELDFHVDIK